MTAAIRITTDLRPRSTPGRRDLRDVRARRAPVARPVRSRPSEATFRRRRAIVGTSLAVLVAVGAVAATDVLAGSGGVPASAAASQPAHLSVEQATVVALPGDTLWSIADRFRGDIPISRYVDTMVDLNGGASIQAGQTILLP